VQFFCCRLEFCHSYCFSWIQYRVLGTNPSLSSSAPPPCKYEPRPTSIWVWLINFF
jgi:hypothetical protein